MPAQLGSLMQRRADAARRRGGNMAPVPVGRCHWCAPVCSQFEPVPALPTGRRTERGAPGRSWLPQRVSANPVLTWRLGSWFRCRRQGSGLRTAGGPRTQILPLCQGGCGFNTGWMGSPRGLIYSTPRFPSSLLLALRWYSYCVWWLCFFMNVHFRSDQDDEWSHVPAPPEA